MGVLDFIKKLSKMMTKLSFSSLSTRYKILLALAAAVLLKYFFGRSANTKNIIKVPLSQFLSPLNLHSLNRVRIYPNQIIAIDKFSNLLQTQYAGMPSDLLYKQLNKSGAVIQFVGNYVNNQKLDFLLLFVSICSSILLYYLYKKDGFQKKASRPQQKVKFDDIVGLESAKSALREVMDYMMNPSKYKDRGARMRRGILLYGPPGTGKTTLAKACANQVGIPFYACNAAQFCQIYVGMGPKKVRQLFAKAKQTSPSVIFIDELDAIGSRNNQHSFMIESANSQKNSTINQILSQLDGFETSDQVLVIAATNRLQMVDKSLIRSGRFDIKIQVNLPPLDMKVKIFEKYIKKTKNNLNEQFIHKLLEKAQFCSGADIEALVNQSIYLSIRRNSNLVQQQDILNAIKQQSGI